MVLLVLGEAAASPPGAPPGNLPAVPASASSDTKLLEGLSALHQGRFSEGQKLFRAFLEGDPADPRGHLFLAFSEWWKLLELRGAGENPEMEFHLQESIRLAQEKLEDFPDDPETLASIGTGYIFLAQYRASQRKIFRAAVAAKKGKGFLERALKSKPDLVDSRFGLGAYNYYADKVNVLVKGLRTILFLPGGDSELGLSQLQEVADKGRYFRTEAHLLLAIIYQGRHERRYLESLSHLRSALDLNSGSPLILMSLGELQIRLGRYPEAQATLGLAARAGRRSPDPDQTEMGRFSRILLADSLELSLNTAAALKELERSLDGTPIQPDLRSRALALATRAALRLGDTRGLERIYDRLGADGAERDRLRRSYAAERTDGEFCRRLEPALRLMDAGEWSRAAPLLEDLQLRYPDSSEIRLHRARLLFEQGRWTEAEARLRETSREAGAASPGWVEGWRNLYLGRTLAAQGRKTEGTVFYSVAAETHGFRAKDLAYALLGPEGSDPALWPEKIFALGIQESQDAEDVGPGLPERGDSTMAIDRLLSGVVGG